MALSTSTSTNQVNPSFTRIPARVIPGHVVVAAACATFISAANRPHGRIMHKIAPPEAKTLDSELNRLYRRISAIRTRLHAQRQGGESVRQSRLLIVRKT